MHEADRLQLAVAECHRLSSSLAVVGHGSKALLGPLKGDDTLSTQSLSGIIDYRPEELVVTAWAGTSLVELTEVLAEKRQMLPFDPPRFDGAGTLGGALASGLSGPARPWRGSVRDAVLGVEIVNGRGQRLRFGGSVMKNVAGYDVSRLMVGARGMLGVILSASVRVLPMPATEATLAVACDAGEAGRLVRDLARRPLPITATCYFANTLHLRLSGSAASVASARSALGLGEPGDPTLWAAVRDHAHPFFGDSAGTITRLALPRGVAIRGRGRVDRVGRLPGLVFWRVDRAAARRVRDDVLARPATVDAPPCPCGDGQGVGALEGCLRSTRRI